MPKPKLKLKKPINWSEEFKCCVYRIVELAKFDFTSHTTSEEDRNVIVRNINEVNKKVSKR